MKHKSLVSIIIPCYNYGRFLSEAIDSALNQTYKNIEIIVVDDGSTDDTDEVIARYKDKIRYFKQSNKGVCMARNKGIAMSKGDYIVMLDADDWLAHDYIDLCMEKLQTFRGNSSVGYIFTQVQHFGKENFITNYPEYSIDILTNSGPYINVSALIDKAKIGKVRFNNNIKTGYEDWDFYLSLFEHGVEGRLLNKPLLWYRKTGSIKSISARTEGPKKLYRAKIAVMRLHPELFPTKLIYKFKVMYWSNVIKIKVKQLAKKVLVRK